MELRFGWDNDFFDLSFGWADNRLHIGFDLNLYEERFKSSGVRIELINLFFQFSIFW